MASLLVALALCPAPALEAHGLADLARLETRADVVLVAPAAPVAAAEPAPAAAPAAAPAPASKGEGEPEVASVPPLALSVRPLRGEALATLATALLAAAARGAPTPGVSGLFAETAGTGLVRLWVGGVPIGPNRILRVAVDEGLAAGPLAPWLSDPALPVPEPGEGPPALAWERVEVAAAALAARRSGLGAGWIPSCPRAGGLR